MTGRQSTPGPGHCSNRKQLLNSSRKGRQDSHPSVQTVQAGRGPGLQEAGPIGGAGTWPVRPAAPGMTYRTLYRPNLGYFTFDIVISRYCNTIWYSIPSKNFDIEYLLSVQRASKLNIVPDIDGFPTISKQYRVYKEHLFGGKLERPQYRALNIVPDIVYYIAYDI